MRCNHVTSDAQPGLLKRFSGGSYEENGPWLRGIGPICRISQRTGNPELARLSPSGVAKFAQQDGVRAGELARLRLNRVKRSGSCGAPAVAGFTPRSDGPITEARCSPRPLRPSGAAMPAATASPAREQRGLRARLLRTPSTSRRSTRRPTPYVSAFFPSSFLPPVNLVGSFHLYDV